MKTLLMILTMLCLSFSSSLAFAYSDNESSARLQQEISVLKEKIRNSKDVRSKDLQKLTELENQLQKSQFLNKSHPSR